MPGFLYNLYALSVIGEVLELQLQITEVSSSTKMTSPLTTLSPDSISGISQSGTVNPIHYF